ncbi:peptidase M15 family domain protein [Acinetobacter baumannii 972082]|nr:peptidase M15 family domain protein [Acinetobacter baumannii 972082]
MVGCASSPQHTTTGKTSPSGKRIFIPQERVIIERPFHLKLNLLPIALG